MRLYIACVGRLKKGPIQDIIDDYSRRLPWQLVWREVEEKRPLPATELKAREAVLLQNALPKEAPFIALDEQGKTPDSRAFASLLSDLGQSGGGTLGFVIGGANGLAAELRQQARATISFGRLTWPHMLVRAMLAEQLFRAHTIQSGHPYHRD